MWQFEIGVASMSFRQSVARDRGIHDPPSLEASLPVSVKRQAGIAELSAGQRLACILGNAL